MINSWVNHPICGDTLRPQARTCRCRPVCWKQARLPEMMLATASRQSNANRETIPPRCPMPRRRSSDGGKKRDKPRQMKRKLCLLVSRQSHVGTEETPLRGAVFSQVELPGGQPRLAKDISACRWSMNTTVQDLLGQERTICHSGGFFDFINAMGSVATIIKGVLNRDSPWRPLPAETRYSDRAGLPSRRS